MTLKKVRGGDSLKTGQINQFVDEFNRIAASGTGRRLDRNLLPGNPIWAVNNTGVDLYMGEVAAIDSSPYVGNAAGILTDNLVLTLRETGEGDEDNWVVAANWIPAGEAGWVYSAGVALARLEPEGSGSPPGDYVQAVPGEKYLERSDRGAGLLVVDLGQVCSAGVGEWGLVRFAGASNTGEGAGPSPGTPTTYIQKEGDGDPGSGSPYMRADALFELRRRVGSGPVSGTEHESGLEMAEEEDRIGVLWEKDSGYILDVAGTTASVGDRGTVARGNHQHAFDGSAFAGTGVSWSAGQFHVTPAPSPGTPTTYIQKEGDGNPGSGAPYMRADALFELRLRAGSGPASGTEDESGLEMAEEEDKLGVLWEKDSGYILDVNGTTASVGDRGTVARGNHRHAFDGSAFAGTGISWSGGQFNVSVPTPPSKYTSIPEAVDYDTVGAAGSSDDYSPGDHKHPFDGSNLAGAGLNWYSGGGVGQFRNDYSPATNPPPNIAASSSLGIQAAKFAREDHTHGIDVTAGGGLEISGGYLQMETPTDGDLWYGGGGYWGRLGIGTAGDVLTVVSGAPAWNRIGTSDLTFDNGVDLVFGTGAGTNLGKAANQKSAFHGATPVVQASHISDPSGGTTQDAEARTAINAILVALENKGILASA